MDSRAAVGCCLVFVVIGVCVAQKTQPRDPRDVNRETNRRDLDTILLRKPILATEDVAARQALLKQINEDFKSLQVLNNNLMRAIKDESAVVDFKSLANTLSELGSKASRLRENLLLPEVEKEKESRSFKELETVQQFKQALMEFDTIVARFATNPIFQQNNVIDIELAKNASRDLEWVIKQSGRLKKAASKLNK